MSSLDTMSTCSSASGQKNNSFMSTSQSRPSSPTAKLTIKTLCFARKSLVMPSKDEYRMLSDYGLGKTLLLSYRCQGKNESFRLSGCRKWTVGVEWDAEMFKAMVYKIYPRLTSVPGYTLWNLKQDNSFEKLPAKVFAVKLLSKPQLPCFRSTRPAESKPT